MNPTPADGVTATASAHGTKLLVPSLVGGTAIYLAALVLEVFQPDTVAFLSWVFGLPLAVGAVMGARGRRPARAAGPFVVAYLVILVHDWIATGGDQVFHLVLAALTGGLAALATVVAGGVHRRLVPRPS